MIATNILLNALLIWQTVTGIPTDPVDEDNLQTLLETENAIADETIIADIVTQLNQTMSYEDHCGGCIDRLIIGKSLAAAREDLVAPVFTMWCKLSQFYDNDTCVQQYGISTVNGSSLGSNFVDMLDGMDPTGYDGLLYCHYYENNNCPKPETPNVTVSHLWPPKSPEHMSAPEPGNNGTFNVLHISDINIQLDYAIGSESNCTDALCCSSHSHNKQNLTGTSPYNGYWNSYYNSYFAENGSYVQGSYIDVFNMSNVWTPATTSGNYNCDTPEVLVNSTLEDILEYSRQNNITYDFTLFTGGMGDSDQAKYLSFENAVSSDMTVFNILKDRLGKLPVFPVIGNQDSYPHGQLAPLTSNVESKFSWNYNLLSNLWEEFGWLNAEQAQQAREHYTGYAVETQLGLKVIALNSNAWFNKNTYSYVNASQPDNFGQFSFLIEELVASEAKNQRVWIVAHIPPAFAGLPVPSNVFSQIVERFSPSTIAGIFFGHTHEDQFEILYASSGNDTKSVENALNQAYIAPSVSPLGGVNPAWRFYQVDKTTFSIMNVHNYYSPLNSTFTSNGTKPTWFHEYSSRYAYNISWPTTSPLNATYWHLVAEQIGSSVVIRQKYEQFTKRQSPYGSDCYNSKECDNDYCFVTSFTVDEYETCVAAQ